MGFFKNRQLKNEAENKTENTKPQMHMNQIMRSMAKTFTGNSPAYISGFLFQFYRGQVRIINFQPDGEIPFRQGSCNFAADGKGCYFICRANQPGRAAWVNGALPVTDKKYYLMNDDVIVLQELESSETMLFQFTILNQFSSSWQFLPYSYLASAPLEGGLFHPDPYGNLMVRPECSQEEVYVNRRKTETGYCLQPYEGIDICDRHYLYTGHDLYIQNPLSPDQHLSLALMNKQLNPEVAFDINIVKREARNMDYSKKLLLEDIRLTLHPGEMVLIIGGSGAGKTTFFNAVMGTEKADAEIMLGDKDLYRNYESLKHQIGYVQQNDLLRPGDTVYDTLLSTAKMSLPAEIVQDPALLKRRVMDVLEKLRIEKEADSLVSKLSGGQRKRLSIAKEYISEPPLFFLDEPDTGLDSNQSSILMHNLRDIADTGKIVLVISHYPSRTPELFNKVLVLAKSRETNCGKMAYFGSIPDAVQFFEVTNIDDIIRRIDEDPDYFIGKYKQMRGNLL